MLNTDLLYDLNKMDMDRRNEKKSLNHRIKVFTFLRRK